MPTLKDLLALAKRAGVVGQKASAAAAGGQVVYLDWYQPPRPKNYKDTTPDPAPQRTVVIREPGRQIISMGLTALFRLAPDESPALLDRAIAFAESTRQPVVDASGRPAVMKNPDGSEAPILDDSSALTVGDRALVQLRIIRKHLPTCLDVAKAWLAEVTAQPGQQ